MYIAIENGIVVDRFSCNEQEIQERKLSRPDIVFKEIENVFIGQTQQEDGTFVYIEKPYSQPQEKVITLDEKVNQLYDMVAYLLTGEQNNPV